MSAKLSRVRISLKPTTFRILEKTSKLQREPLSMVVSKLVEEAVDLYEDLALVELAEKRLNSFKRKNAFSTEDIIKSVSIPN